MALNQNQKYEFVFSQSNQPNQDPNYNVVIQQPSRPESFVQNGPRPYNQQPIYNQQFQQAPSRPQHHQAYNQQFKMRYGGPDDEELIDHSHLQSVDSLRSFFEPNPWKPRNQLNRPTVTLRRTASAAAAQRRLRPAEVYYSSKGTPAGSNRSHSADGRQRNNPQFQVLYPPANRHSMIVSSDQTPHYPDAESNFRRVHTHEIRNDYPSYATLRRSKTDNFRSNASGNRDARGLPLVSKELFTLSPSEHTTFLMHSPDYGDSFYQPMDGAYRSNPNLDVKYRPVYFSNRR